MVHLDRKELMEWSWKKYFSWITRVYEILSPPSFLLLRLPFLPKMFTESRSRQQWCQPLILLHPNSSYCSFYVLLWPTEPSASCWSFAPPYTLLIFPHSVVHFWSSCTLMHLLILMYSIVSHWSFWPNPLSTILWVLKSLRICCLSGCHLF